MAKKDKNKKNKVKEEKNNTKDPNYVNEIQKQFYDNEIAAIRAKIERQKGYQIELREETAQVKEKTKEMELIKNEIITELETNLKEKKIQAEESKDQYRFLIEEFERKRIWYEDRIKEIEEALEEMVERLSKEVEEQQEYLKMILDFKENKELMFEKFADSLKVLEEKEKEHQRHLFLLEEKFEEGRRRMKRELENKIFQMSYEFQSSTGQKMPNSLLRLIHENIAIENELHQMNNSFEEMITRITTLEKNKRRMLRLIPERENYKISAITKTKLGESIIGKLEEQRENMEKRVDEMVYIEGEKERLNEKLRDVTYVLDRAKHELGDLKRAIQSKEEQVTNMKHKLALLRRIIRRLSIILQNAMRGCDEILAVKLIPTGELEDETKLPYDQQIRIYKQRRERLFKKRGRYLDALVSLLLRAQLNGEEIALAEHEDIDLVKFNFQNILPDIESVESSDEEGGEDWDDESSEFSRRSIANLSNESLPRIHSQASFLAMEGEESDASIQSMLAISKDLMKSMLLQSKLVLKQTKEKNRRKEDEAGEDEYEEQEN